ncbi:MAG: hypothetical protein LBD42_09270 [Desulfovibrio sp.]|jgi:hypothetical protein|nr:hypothetical protein [Desulfovibrio sp.]
MVSGKPILTFGDNRYEVSSQNQQRSGGAKIRKDQPLSTFASYLSAMDYGGKAEAQQNNRKSTGAQAGAQARQYTPVPQPANTGGATGHALKSAESFARRAAAGYPELSRAGMAERHRGDSPGVSPSRRNTPAIGGNSKVEAGAYARSGMEAFNGGGNMGTALARKHMPRISGQTTLGRYGFGMVDTRKADAGVSAAQPRGAGQKFDGDYAGYGGKLKNGQSFLTHGFGGGNAELALRSVGYDMREMQPDVTYARRLDSGAGVAVRSGKTDSGDVRPAAAAYSEGGKGARAADMPGGYGKTSEGRAAVVPSSRSLAQSFYTMVDKGLGALAAKFESGSEGISAIGFDRVGGTSYGKYQIASRVGTMAAFIEYLGEKAPDIAKRLQAAGPANTGGRSGKMPAEWKNIAGEEPARFEKLQEDFILASHFEPAMRSISESTGIGFAHMPEALQEVLFSTAVQHGPLGAVRIFNQAMNSVGVNKLRSGNGVGTIVSESFKRAGRQLIKQIYALRAGQFSLSSSEVQTAVKKRLSQEMKEALGMMV